MAVDKEIKFKFVVDQASLSSAKSQIEQLISTFSKLRGEAQGAAKQTGDMFQGLLDPFGRPVASGAGGQSSTPVTGGATTSTVNKKISVPNNGNIGTSLTEIISKHRNVYKGIAQSGKEGMDMLTEALKRSVEIQTREIDKLEKEIQKITKAYAGATEEYKKAVASGDTSKAAGLQKNTDEMLASRVSLEGAKRGAMEQLAKDKESLYPTATLIQDEKSGGLTGLLTKNLGGGGLGGASGIAALLGATVDFAIKETMGQTRFNTSENARRGQLLEPTMRSAIAGDTRFAVGLLQMSRDQGARADFSAQHGNKSSTLRAGSKEAQALAAAANMMPVAGPIVSGAIQAAGYLGKDLDFSPAGMEQSMSATKQALGGIPLAGGPLQFLGAGEAPKTSTLLGAFTDKHQQTNMVENMLNQVYGFNKQTSQLYINMAQERFMGELSQRASTQRILGIGGLSGGKYNKGQDPFSDLKLSLEAEGYNLGLLTSAHQSVRGVAGDRAAARRKRQVMSAQAAGYSGYEHILGISERMGYGSRLADIAIGGRIDPTAGIMLGSSLLGTGFSPGGLTSGAGVMAAFQGGFQPQGNAQDFVKIQQALAGLQFGNSIFTGASSPYLQGSNLLAAIQAAPGKGSYYQDMLAQMDARTMIDIVSGKQTDKTKIFDYMGGDANDVRATMNRKISGALSLVASAQLPEGSLAQKAYQNWRSYEGAGGVADDYAKKLGKTEEGKRELEALYGLAGVANQGFAESEAGMAFGMLVSGIGTDPKLRKGLGVSIKGREADALKKQAELQNPIYDALKGLEVSGDMAKAYQMLPELVQKMHQFGTGAIQGAEELGNALIDLSNIVIAVGNSLTTGKPVELPQKSSRAEPKGQTPAIQTSFGTLQFGPPQSNASSYFRFATDGKNSSTPSSPLNTYTPPSPSNKSGSK